MLHACIFEMPQIFKRRITCFKMTIALRLNEGEWNSERSIRRAASDIETAKWKYNGDSGSPYMYHPTDIHMDCTSSFSERFVLTILLLKFRAFSLQSDRGRPLTLASDVKVSAVPYEMLPPINSITRTCSVL